MNNAKKDDKPNVNKIIYDLQDFIFFYEDYLFSEIKKNPDKTKKIVNEGVRKLESLKLALKSAKNDIDELIDSVLTEVNS
jgi:hypothetical protein